MTSHISYSCPYENLFTVEAELAASGYVLAQPWQCNVDGGEAALLLRDRTAIILSYPPGKEVAEIEIWGEAAAVAEVLQSLPIVLHIQPHDPAIQHEHVVGQDW